MITVLVAGKLSGRMMWRNICHELAPSTRAASKYSFGMAAMPAM